MDRLRHSEQRLERAVVRLEARLSAAKAMRKDIDRGLALADSIEERAKLALKSVRDLVRQHEGK